ncbi:MAG: PH domain-containing protein [Candidatus Acidoferrales bacterium]
MRESTEKAAEWVYRGIWRALSDWFRVPEHPPTLPAAEGEFIMSFHPSRRYLSYLKLYFCIALVVVDVAILSGWIALLVWNPRVGMLLAAPALAVAVVPDIVAYIAIHLRYDTMWYVMTDRSLRCRRGIWVILEHTITFENVQNVHVRWGPVQHFFGISTIVVETAGAAEGEDQNEFAVGNKAIMEGIDNPNEVRQLIMERVQRSRSAGLGDERPSNASASRAWSVEHLRALRQILEEVRALS